MEIVEAKADIGDRRKHAVRLLKKEKFDVIHMHLKKGEDVSTHHAPCPVTIFVRSGKVRLNIEGKEVTITNEDILYLDPYEKHSLHALENTDLILTKIF